MAALTGGYHVAFLVGAAFAAAAAVLGAVLLRRGTSPGVAEHAEPVEEHPAALADAA
jgi:hypothetical protein